MDMITVDLPPCHQTGIGSKGKNVVIDEVAYAAGTVGYKLMCALAP